MPKGTCDPPGRLDAHTGLVRLWSIFLVALAAGVLAGCGGSQGAGTGDAETGLPQVTVDRVAGGRLDLSKLTPGGRPLLVWAWSPI